MLMKILKYTLYGVFVLGFLSLGIEYGFNPGEYEQELLHRLDILILWYFGLYYVVRLILSDSKINFVKQRWLESFIVLMVIIHFIYTVVNFGFLQIFDPDIRIHVPKILVLSTQIGFLFIIITEATNLNKKIAELKLHPSHVLLLSFFLIILIGTGLLMLPGATASGQGLGFIDALFTATSATCVTGLIVVDTGTYFSQFGQIIILLLIQIGGLGIMTFTSFFVIIFRRNISFREKSLAKEILNYDLVGIMNQVLKFSILLTFGFELIGAVSLLIFWGHTFSSPGEAIYSSIFHSVSAFCNAGFSLNSNSLESFSGNYGVLLTIGSLIIIGGLGFPVLINIFKLPFFSRFKINLNMYGLHTRLVMLVTSNLLIFGTLFFMISEWNHTLSEFNLGEKILNAFFQSVTTRTAGFNSVTISHVQFVTLVSFMVLMFIGASPGSTGGGVKTTTFGVIIASLKAIIKNRPTIELYRREIPMIVFHRAILVVIVSLIYIIISYILLVWSNNLPYEQLLFELFSAYGTVGLSTGITSQLNSFGKIIIIISMYFGRVGVFTLLLAVMRPASTTARYRYPSANVMVG
ncbi:MAG: TrkH family potassium uptake protein [Calditrichia bacterium]